MTINERASRIYDNTLLRMELRNTLLINYVKIIIDCNYHVRTPVTSWLQTEMCIVSYYVFMS